MPSATTRPRLCSVPLWGRTGGPMRTTIMLDELLARSRRLAAHAASLVQVVETLQPGDVPGILVAKAVVALADLDGDLTHVGELLGHGLDPAAVCVAGGGR